MSVKSDKEGSVMDANKEKKGISPKIVFCDFATWSTIVCLAKIVTSGRAMSIIFTFIFIVMLFFFVFISTMCIIRFFKYPSSIELTIETQALAFPRFSFCNENPMKMSLIQNDPKFADIVKLSQQYQEIEQGLNSVDDFGLKLAPSRLNRLKQAQITLRMLMAKIPDADRIRVGYAYSDIVTECTFSGQTCSSTHFTQFLHPDYGVCYTFNINFVTNRPGPRTGLRIMFSVNQNRPSDNFDFLPTTDSSSVWAVAHDEGDLIDFGKNGFRVSSSFQTFIALSKVEYNRLDEPYGKCADNDPEVNKYYEKYTASACQAVCLQKMANTDCGCVDPLYNKISEQRYCETKEEMSCLIYVTQKRAAANTVNRSSLCDCDPSCTEDIYKMKMSSSIFPSDNYQVATGTQAQRNVLLQEQGGGRPGEGNNQDYEAPPTTSTTGTSSTQPQSSTVSIPTTVNSDCKINIPPNPTDDESKCRTDFADIYNNSAFTIIQGFPCISKKPCQSCILLASPSVYAWPCQYSTFGIELTGCHIDNVTDLDCYKMFKYFDYIPIGSQTLTFSADSTYMPCSTMSETALPACKGTTTCYGTQTSDKLDDAIYSNPNLLDSSITTPGNSIGPLKTDQGTCYLSNYAYQLGLQSQSSQGGKSGCIGVIGCILGRKKRDISDAATTTFNNTIDEANNTIDIPGYGSCEYANTNFKSASQCIQWYRQNGLIIHVYFETLQVEIYTQQATYQLVSMVSDVSGHAGLWLGISVISLVEIVAFFIMCLNWLFCGKNITIKPDRAQIAKSIDEEKRATYIN